MTRSKDEPALVSSKNRDGETPLHLAAENGDKKMVELLLANQADVNATDGTGDTPLHLAVSYHHDAVAQLLREHGGHE